MAMACLWLVGPSPADATAAGIQGMVTNASGTGVSEVPIDLFAANGDGSRSTYLGSYRTNNGYYYFGPADGCYVITMTAPANDSFVGASKWYQRPVCVSGGKIPDYINATLSGGGGGGVVAPPSCTPGQPIWNLAFEDQFSGDGAAIGPSWQVFNSVGNAGYGLRRPSAVSLWGGYLNIKASMENGSLVSGGLSSSLGLKYGRYEFRARTDKDPSEATSGVVLTWPTSNVHPRDGENNIYETLWFPGNRAQFYTYIHKPYGTVHDQDYTIHYADASQWHTMVMEWAPDKLVIYRDGQMIKTITETSADLIPDNPHVLSIQFDAWASSIAAPAWMQVDYVKMWSYGGKTTC